MKGQHELEYAWFAIADSMPGLSMSADRAAKKIIEACRYGDPELTLTIPAKLAVRVNHIAPASVARAITLVNKLLPGPAGPEGNRHRRGKQSKTPLTDSVATALTDKAARANNEL